MTVLAAALTDSYVRHGHCTVRRVLDSAEVSEALDHLARLTAASPVASAVVTAPMDGEALFARMATDRRLLDIAAALLRDTPTAFGCTYVVKPPRIGLPALWHQDGHPWRTGLGITDAVTLWIALDVCDAGNGCLRVLPGTHHAPAGALRPRGDVPNLFGCELDRAGVDAAGAVDVELMPGDLSAHHPDLIHGSEPNLSERPRRALVVRFRAA